MENIQKLLSLSGVHLTNLNYTHQLHLKFEKAGTEKSVIFFSVKGLAFLQKSSKSFLNIPN
jgi:hypothetical protein